ncbi:hypothetical protein [Streptomyces coeruleorubidus]
MNALPPENRPGLLDRMHDNDLGWRPSCSRIRSCGVIATRLSGRLSGDFTFTLKR